MFSGYIIAVSFIALLDTSFSFENDNCNFFCDTNGCKSDAYYKEHNFSSIETCTNEDISTDVNFSIIEHKHDHSFLSKEHKYNVKINLKPPRNKCNYKITLYADESVSEEHCKNYGFQRSLKKIHSEIFVCFVSENNQYKENTTIFVPYIFTACYTVEFQFETGTKLIESNKFFKTNYKRVEITSPVLECRYTVTNKNNTILLTYWVDMFNVTAVAEIIVTLEEWNGHESQCPATYSNTFSTWKFNILDHIGNDTTVLRNGKYNYTWKNEIEISEQTEYCVIISLYEDIRCQRNTLWNPSYCSVYEPCNNITKNRHTILSPNSMPEYSVLIIIVIIIIVLCTLTSIAISNCSYIINAHRKMWKTFKYTKVINTDIVLLYSKQSESFMALMTKFRHKLCQHSQCVVHDWYDIREWNSLTESDPSSWFDKLLCKGCRVIWIDTPLTRSLINENSVKKISDFRDKAFPTIFKIFKLQVLSKSKHFIVRVEGFENFEDNSDPFIDLLQVQRYCIPQDLQLLYSNFSTINEEEDLIQQHLLDF